VKTFVPAAWIVVTGGEFAEAATSRSSYRLVGVINDGGPPPASWRTVLVRDPLMVLLREGRFATSPELHVTADALIRVARR
jgi:hypothetical protein